MKTIQTNNSISTDTFQTLELAQLDTVSGGGLLARRADTQPFNGYATQVASLYSGMDLRRNY